MEGKQGREASVFQRQTTIHDSQPPKVKCRKVGSPVEKMLFLLQNNAFSYGKMHFPAEECLFLQKKKRSLFVQKNAILGGTGREIAGGLQGSRIKNAAQLSQESAYPHDERFTPQTFSVRDAKTFEMVGAPIGAKAAEVARFLSGDRLDSDPHEEDTVYA